MVDIVRQVLEAELEPLPPGVEDEPEKPVRAEEKDGRFTTDPSWRLRTHEFWLSFEGCLRVGGGGQQVAVSVQALVAKIALTTDEEKRNLDNPKRYAGDWKLLAFSLDRTAKKTRMRRVVNSNWATQAATQKLVEQMAMKEASNRGATLPGMAPGPAKTTLERTPDEGILVTLVWFDASRSEEHDNTASGAKVQSSIAKYLKSGYFPREFQKQRTQALRLVKERFSRSQRQPDVTAVDSDVFEAVMDMLNAGKSPATIAKVLRLNVALVERTAIAWLADREKNEAEKREKSADVGATPKEVDGNVALSAAIAKAEERTRKESAPKGKTP
jgi:hypothetical protein